MEGVSWVSHPARLLGEGLGLVPGLRTLGLREVEHVLLGVGVSVWDVWYRI